MSYQSTWTIEKSLACTQAERDVRLILGAMLGAGGLWDTYWGRRIILSARDGGFTSELIEMASRWPTCACGDMWAREPYPLRADDGAASCPVPSDASLRHSGKRFYEAVESHHATRAAEFLVRIEQRGAELRLIHHGDE